VDQGIEHSAGASFAKNPAYFDPESIVKLALEGGCNAVASTPHKFDQIFFARIKQAWDMGAVAVGATIYFGSPESSRQIVEVGEAFKQAHEMGMATVLWCSGRKAFPRPMAEGVKLLNAIQDVYLCKEVTIA
jgi:class I fructose-bisphosphate aldolase